MGPGNCHSERYQVLARERILADRDSTAYRIRFKGLPLGAHDLCHIRCRVGNLARDEPHVAKVRLTGSVPWSSRALALIDSRRFSLVYLDPESSLRLSG